MKKYLVFLTITVLISACNPTSTVTPSSPVPNLPVESTAIPSPLTDTPVAGNQPAPAVTSEATGNLALQVLSPLDEAIVNTPQVDVVGSTAAGAVVSINDEILLAGADGQFKATISLEEGPNLIEILASDADGNESSLILTVTYEP